MKKNYTIFLSLLLLLLSSCHISKYKEINKIQQSGNYTLSIEEIDKMLKTEKNGYYQTLALQDRSEAYYQLGLSALEKENTNLAIRLFYISNTDKADDKIIEAYERRITDFTTHNQIENVLLVYNYIINNLYQSPRVPEYLYKRMTLNLEHFNNYPQVWFDFVTINDNFPKCDYVKPASELIDTFIITKIDSIFSLKDSTDEIQDLVDNLLYIRKYPTSYKDYINQKISNLYVFHSERLITQQNYVKAEENFRIALQYDKSKEDYIKKRLLDICELFIVEGDNYLKDKEIDLAIISYQRSFSIIPDYDKAAKAIQKAEQLRQNISQAQELYTEAQQLIRAKEHQQALKLLKQANTLDSRENYQKAVFEITNIIEIEKNPQEFALKIIKEYDNGRIFKAVETLKEQLYDYWGNEVRDSGWRAVRAVGLYRMEIRYDLITPDENNYLAWQVNMRDKQVIPLNKLTEKLLEQKQ
jgi:tetratricopeptide (TPR) repeat protein